MAGWSRFELIGANHNIIRHPDMPKIAFKILWDLIQNKKEFFGFVKNLRKDGGYYWVVANISPTFDANNKIIGYYSVRRKPHHNFKSIIEPLYKHLKEIEETSGMEAATQEVYNLLESKKLEFNELMIKIQKGIINEL